MMNNKNKQSLVALSRKNPKGLLAEKERFELSNRFTGYTISSRAPSTKLGDFSTDKSCSSTNVILAHNPPSVKRNFSFPLIFRIGSFFFRVNDR